MRRTLQLALVMIVGLDWLPLSATQQDWSQFRGPRAGVAADDAALPEAWSRTENVTWSTRIPGTGWSSPVVWGDHVFVTSVISAGDREAPKPGLYFGGERPAPTAEHRWMVYAIDFTSGTIRWEREVHRARPASSRHLKNSYASETPVTDGTRVYAYFGNVGLFVFDMNGTPLWSKDFGAVNMRNGWGTAASPVLHRGRLYLVNDNDTQSFLAAFDAATGREIWRVTRDERSNWATPFVWEHDGGAQIVTSGSDKVRAYDLEGRLRWELKGMSSIAIPTPFAAHGLLFVSSGYVGDALRPMYAIRPGAAGDISLKAGESANAHIAWSHPQLGSYNTTALVYGDYLYTLLDRGFLLMHDARTGKEIYGRQRLAPDTSGFIGLTVGVQRKDLRRQRGRRYVRDSGRRRLQAARPQPARRDDHGLSSHCARQPRDAHGLDALSHLEAGGRTGRTLHQSARRGGRPGSVGAAGPARRASTYRMGRGSSRTPPPSWPPPLSWRTRRIEPPPDRPVLPSSLAIPSERATEHPSGTHAA